MSNTRRTIAVATTAALFSITGCSHAGGGADRSGSARSEVATVHGASPGVAAASAVSVNDQRPLIRPDSSTEDRNALQNAWTKCLAERGVPTVKDATGTVGKPAANPADPPYAAAFTACAAKEPEGWLAREARTDPAYGDLMREVVQCLKDKGYANAHLENTPPQVKYGSVDEFLRADRDESACVSTVFVAKIKSTTASGDAAAARWTFAATSPGGPVAGITASRHHGGTAARHHGHGRTVATCHAEASASVGVSRAARTAGYTPAAMPTTIAPSSPPPAADIGTTVGQCW
jgi:hypothetical protein